MVIRNENELIQGQGPGKPAGMFISDVPITTDYDTNYALSGFQHSTLEDLCQGAHLNVYEFYKTVLIKEKPPEPGNTYYKSELNKAKAKEFFPILLQEIKALNPYLLIPLGEFSFNFLTGLNSINKFRGSVIPSSPHIDLPSVKVMPILGPYPYLFQSTKDKVIARIDFAKIGKYLNDSPCPDNLFNIWVARDSNSLRMFFERHYTKAKFVVFDIETFLGVPTCISFCFDGFESVCVPLLDSSITRDYRVLMMDLVARMLASPLPKVNQNIKYDWKILERWGFYVNNVIGDTALASSVLYCEFPKNLGFLTSIYTDLPYFKDEGKEFDPTKFKKEQFYLYNAKDSLSVSQIYTKQQAEIEELGVKYVYNQLCKLLPIYRRMEDRGLRVDDTRRQNLLSKYETLYRLECLKLSRLSGLEYVNPQSPKQVDILVYQELGFTHIHGAKSTDEKSLETLMAKGVAEKSPILGKEILQCVLNCRKLHKVVEILEAPLYPDGRMRQDANLGGTETGRTSGGQTLDQLIVLDDKNKITTVRLGHSLQTIGKHGFVMDGMTYGKDVRSVYVPTHGYRHVEIDLSQAEARVDRVLSGSFDMSVFDAPGIHRLTASWIFDCKPGDIKKEVMVDGVDRYFLGKTVRHAGERNMGPDMLMSMTQLPISQCSRILEKFHKFQPEIRGVFHRDITREINERRYLVAPNGRRRDFFDRPDKHSYNEGISMLPQAIVSDQTKFSFIPTFAECPWAHLLVEMHDGALIEVPIGREMEFAEVYKKNVETPIDFRFGSLPRDYELTIPSELSIGDSWGSLEEVSWR